MDTMCDKEKELSEYSRKMISLKDKMSALEAISEELSEVFNLALDPSVPLSENKPNDLQKASCKQAKIIEDIEILYSRMSVVFDKLKDIKTRSVI